MGTTADFPLTDPLMLMEFLTHIVPFNELDGEKLRELSKRFTMKFFPKETLVFRQDVDDVNDFYLIYKGGAKTYLTGPDGAVTLLDFRGEGDYFGALGIIRGSKANFNVETLEDTYCLVLDKVAFLDLVHNYPGFSRHYLERFSEDLVGTAYADCD